MATRNEFRFKTFQPGEHNRPGRPTDILASEAVEKQRRIQRQLELMQSLFTGMAQDVIPGKPTVPGPGRARKPMQYIGPETLPVREEEHTIGPRNKVIPGKAGEALSSVGMNPDAPLIDPDDPIQNTALRLSQAIKGQADAGGIFGALNPTPTSMLTDLQSLGGIAKDAFTNRMAKGVVTQASEEIFAPTGALSKASGRDLTNLSELITKSKVMGLGDDIATKADDIGDMVSSAAAKGDVMDTPVQGVPPEVNPEVTLNQAPPAPRQPNPVFDDLFDAEPAVSMMKTGEGTVGAGFDRSLFKKLGANLYKGNLAQVATKEAVQNSVDSVRDVPGAKISIETNTSENRLKVTDNGHGMAPDVAASQLMDVGGSLKGEGASGGYGLAKVGLFSNAEAIDIRTVAQVGEELVETRIIGSGDDWVNGKLQMTTAPVAQGTPTGTVMDIKLLKDAKPDWYGSRNYITSLVNSSDLGGIQFDVKENGVLPHWLNQKYDPNTGTVVQIKPEPLGTPVETIDLPSSEIRVYPGADQTATGYVTGKILNKGLYQFDLPMLHIDTTDKIPKHVVFDVRPKGKTEDVDYPFTTSREEVKGDVNDAINKYFKNLRQNLVSKQMAEIKDAIDSPFRIENTDKNVYITSKRVPVEFGQRIASAPYSRRVTQNIEPVIQSIWSSIKQTHTGSAMEPFEFGGFGLSPDYLGVNISRQMLLAKAKASGIQIPQQVIDSATNLILLNPYATLDEGFADMSLGLATGTGKQKKEKIAKFLAEQSWDTMVHEVIHQISRGHGDDFAAAYTRVMHSLARNAASQIDHLYDTWDEALTQGLLNDHKAITTAWGKQQGPDILSSFGAHTGTATPSGGSGSISEESTRSGMGKTNRSARSNIGPSNEGNLQQETGISKSAGSGSPTVSGANEGQVVNKKKVDDVDLDSDDLIFAKQAPKKKDEWTFASSEQGTSPHPEQWNHPNGNIVKTTGGKFNVHKYNQPEDAPNFYTYSTLEEAKKFIEGKPAPEKNGEVVIEWEPNGANFVLKTPDLTGKITELSDGSYAGVLTKPEGGAIFTLNDPDLSYMKFKLAQEAKNFIDEKGKKSPKASSLFENYTKKKDPVGFPVGWTNSNSPKVVQIWEAPDQTKAVVHTVADGKYVGGKMDENGLPVNEVFDTMAEAKEYIGLPVSAAEKEIEKSGFKPQVEVQESGEEMQYWSNAGKEGIKPEEVFYVDESLSSSKPYKVWSDTNHSIEQHFETLEEAVEFLKKSGGIKEPKSDGWTEKTETQGEGAGSKYWVKENEGVILQGPTGHYQTVMPGEGFGPLHNSLAKAKAYAKNVINDESGVDWNNPTEYDYDDAKATKTWKSPVTAKGLSVFIDELADGSGYTVLYSDGIKKFGSFEAAKKWVQKYIGPNAAIKNPEILAEEAEKSAKKDEQKAIKKSKLKLSTNWMIESPPNGNGVGGQHTWKSKYMNVEIAQNSFGDYQVRSLGVDGKIIPGTAETFSTLEEAKTFASELPTELIEKKIESMAKSLDWKIDENGDFYVETDKVDVIIGEDGQFGWKIDYVDKMGESVGMGSHANLDQAKFLAAHEIAKHHGLHPTGKPWWEPDILGTGEEYFTDPYGTAIDEQVYKWKEETDEDGMNSWWLAGPGEEGNITIEEQGQGEFFAFAPGTTAEQFDTLEEAKNYGETQHQMIWGQGIDWNGAGTHLPTSVIKEQYDNRFVNHLKIMNLTRGGDIKELESAFANMPDWQKHLRLRLHGGDVSKFINDLERYAGSDPDYKLFRPIMNDWFGSSKQVKSDLDNVMRGNLNALRVQYYNGTENRIEQLKSILRVIAREPSLAPNLIRGRATDETFEEIMAKYVPGQELDIRVSSFSERFEKAAVFNKRSSVFLFLHLEEGGKATNIMNMDSGNHEEAEWITGGTFFVKDVVVENGYTHPTYPHNVGPKVDVFLRQTAVFDPDLSGRTIKEDDEIEGFWIGAKNVPNRFGPYATKTEAERFLNSMSQKYRNLGLEISDNPQLWSVGDAPEGGYWFVQRVSSTNSGKKNGPFTSKEDAEGFIKKLNAGKKAHKIPEYNYFQEEVE